MAEKIRIAAAQYSVSYFQQDTDFQAKLQYWVAEAAKQQAQLLLFPEYAAMELCSLLSSELQRDLHGQLHAMQALLPLYLDSYQQLAKQYQVTIVAGSFPQQLDNGFVNRAYVLHPDGKVDYQDKQIMTRFETEDWCIQRGEALKVIDSAIGRIAINICYDAEFPLLARQQMEQGADLLLVPSVTDTEHGYHRVRLGSQARALENQCYVVHAPLVGAAAWSPAVDINTGRAGVYTPLDRGFPADGILVQGVMNQETWIYADLNLARTRRIRDHGQVRNYHDWQQQTLT